MKQGHIGWACGSVLTVAALAGCGGDDKTAATGQPPSPAVEFRNADPNTTSPYSDAVRAGSTLYLAGVLGLDDRGALVPGGIVPEAEKALQNLKGVLERNGSSLDRVANCEVMPTSRSATPSTPCTRSTGRRESSPPDTPSA
jgi:enamine deaminase RidA (YjgF/YER057c/UK114 family)